MSSDPAAWRARMSPRVRSVPATLAALFVPLGTYVSWARTTSPPTAGPRTRAGALFVAGWLGGRAAGEELVFRFPLTASRSRPTRTLLSTTAFAGMHAARGRRAVTVQLLNGAAWGCCAAANGSVFWPVLAHAVYNAAIVLREERA